MLFTVIIFIEAACLLFAITFLRGEKKSWWRNFIGFLLLSVLTETGGYFLFFIYHHSNHWLFNLYLPVEISFLFYTLYRLCRSFFSAHLLLLPAYIVFLVLYVFESFQVNWNDYSGNANTFASVTIILSCCLFYYFLLRREYHIVLIKDPSFWLISGLFVFYLGSIGCGLFETSLSEIYKKTNVPVRYIIMLVLNFILYGCWSYAFLCRYRQRISSSS